MRLIDADELMKDRVENDPVRIAAKCAPTAYDVDKVVKQLEKCSREGEIITSTTAFEVAVDIVKSGYME